MTLFCPIIKSHLDNCVSLSSLIQNFVITYILVSTVLYYILLKTNINKNSFLGNYKSYLVNLQPMSFLFDIILITMIFSITFMLHKYFNTIYNNTSENNNTTTNSDDTENTNTTNNNSGHLLQDFTVFIIILNLVSPIVIFLITTLLSSNNNYFNSVVTNRQRMPLKVFLYTLFINLIAVITYSTMLMGYSNILVLPTYFILFIRIFTKINL